MLNKDDDDDDNKNLGMPNNEDPWSSSWVDLNRE